jgi:hypothetical protein
VAAADVTGRSQAEPGGFANDGERQAFERFRDQLQPKGWTIAHNLYVSRREDRGSRARELDLLLLHPQHGIVLIEVKGGRIERRKDGNWYQNDRRMQRDPLQQAGSALFELRDAMREHPRLAALGIVPQTSWMLCLPQVDAGTEGLANLDRSVNFAADQVIDRGALTRPTGVFDGVMRFIDRITRTTGSDGRDAAGDAYDWVSEVVDVLLPRFAFSTSLIGDLEVDQARLVADERIHRDWVENLGALPRLHFEAGAGGGKSVVARLRALSLAGAGKRVLVVCSTASLAKSYQRDVQEKSGGRVLANTLHQVLVLKARQGGRSEAFGLPADGPLTIEQLNALPDQTAAIAAASADRYDALVVDEAQDIGAEIVADLAGFLEDPAGGGIWTFADTFQRFNADRFTHEAEGSTAPPEIPSAHGADIIVMRQNHRNPEPVFRLAEGLRADGIRRFSRKGEISSHQIDYRECASPAAQRGVLEEVVEGLAEQRIQPGRIAVVTLDRTEGNPIFTERRFRGRLSRYLEMGNPQLDANGRRRPVPVESLPGLDPDKVYFDSARRMKGLERGVVILVDVPDPGPVGSLSRQLLYAGATRATTYLCVIATRERIEALKAIANAYRP